MKVIPSATDAQVTISAGLITWDERDRPAFQSVFYMLIQPCMKQKIVGKIVFVLITVRIKQIYRFDEAQYK